jgi:hypothetical protein
MVDNRGELTQKEWIEIALAQDQVTSRLRAALSSIKYTISSAPGVRETDAPRAGSPFIWNHASPVDLKSLHGWLSRVDMTDTNLSALPVDLYRDLVELQAHWASGGAPEIDHSKRPGVADPKQSLRDAIESSDILQAYNTWNKPEKEIDQDAIARAAAWVVAGRFEGRLAGIVEFRKLRSHEIESRKRYLPQVRVTQAVSLDRGDNSSAWTLSGFERFALRLETAGTGYVYSVEPKELSQNVSDVAASERLTSLLASFGAIMPGADVEVTAERLRRSQQLVQGILRRPLVVGYAQGEKGFGWLLGPRFKGAVEGQQFEQATVQHSVQVTLALRGWANEATFDIKTGWIDAGGVVIPSSMHADAVRPVTVTLPTDMDALTSLLMSNTSTLPRKPIVEIPERTAGQPPFTIVGDEPADIVLRGYELWRNPEVYLGSQRADEVRVMPDMRGIVATFRRVQAPPVGPKGVTEVDLLVVTSGGDTREPKAVSILPPRRSTVVANVDQFASIQRTPATMGSQLTIELAPALIPPGFASQRMMLRALTGIPGASEVVEWNPVPALSDRPTSLTLPSLGIKNLASSQLAELLQAGKPGAKFDVALQVQLVANGDWIDATKSDSRTLYVFPDATHKQLKLSNSEIWLSGAERPQVSLKLAEHVVAAYPALQAAILSTEPRLELRHEDGQPIIIPIGGGLHGDTWKVDAAIFTDELIDLLLPAPSTDAIATRNYKVRVTGLPSDFRVTPDVLTFKRSKAK